MPNILGQVAAKINELNAARLAEIAAGKTEIIASNTAAKAAKTTAINNKKAAMLESNAGSHSGLMAQVEEATGEIATRYQNIIDDPSSLEGDIKAISDELAKDSGEISTVRSTHVTAHEAAIESIEDALGTVTHFTDSMDYAEAGFTPVAYSA